MKTVLKAFGITAATAVIVFTLSCTGGGGGGGGIPNPKNPDPKTPESEPESMIEMVSIPEGGFYMGSPGTEPNRSTVAGREDQHEVILTKGFKMGKYPVTQEQYERVMGATISEQDTNYGYGLYGEGPEYPMYYVSWYEAVVFCNKLSVMEGLTPAYSIEGETDTDEWAVVCTEALPSSWNPASKWNEVEIVPGSTGYRLPTEAQWEYACRGDYPDKDTEQSTMPFGIGDGTTMTGDMANFDGHSPYGASGEYSDGAGTYLGETTPVGSYDPNSYGLYDMHGNVYEWCWDWFGYYLGILETDPAGAAASSARVVRGGRWSNPGQALRSAQRGNSNPNYRGSTLGFRLVRPSN